MHCDVTRELQGCVQCYQVKQQTSFTECMACVCVCWHGEPAPTVSIRSDRHDAMFLSVVVMCLQCVCSIGVCSLRQVKLLMCDDVSVVSDVAAGVVGGHICFGREWRPDSECGVPF